MLKQVLLALPVVALVGSLFLLNRVSNHKDYDYRPSVTVVETVEEPAVSTVVSVDAGTEIVRPTAEQLAEQFMLFELQDLIDQAKTPEDKKLIQNALDIRREKLKPLELSPDFETNMKRGLK